MATTYTKGLKTANIHLLGVEDELLIADTVDNPSATRAIGQFLNKEDMVVDLGTHIAEVPFHAVEYIEVTESKSDPIESKNPYGCEPADDGGGDGNCETVFDVSIVAEDTEEGFAYGEVEHPITEPPAELNISINGVVYENVPRISDSNTYFYGASNPAFEEYPFIIGIQESGNMTLVVASANTYRIIAEYCGAKK